MNNDREKNIDISKEAADYKNRIIDMVSGINSQGILEYLYTFIRLFLEKWG